MALWEAETRHARELGVFGAPEDDLYTGVCHLFLSIYRRARLCPALPGFASQADPIPSLFLTPRYSGRQSLGKPNSLKLLSLRKMINLSKNIKKTMKSHVF